MKLKKFLPIIFSAAFFMPAQISAASMTLNTQDAELNSTIMLVARMGGINVSVDDSVKGTISLSLNNIDPIKALKIIAKTKNLHLIEESGIFIITADFNNKRFMQTYVFPIKFADAETLKQAVIISLDPETTTNLSNKLTRTIKLSGLDEGEGDSDSVRISTTKVASDEISSNDEKPSTRSEKIDRKDRVFVNPEINALILYGTPAEYERVKRLLETLDVELKQVSVEAKILAIDKEASKNLGVEWMWSSIDGTYSAQSERNRYSESSNGYSNESSQGWSAQSELSRSSSRKYSTDKGSSYEEENAAKFVLANQLLDANIFSGSGLIQFGRSLTSFMGFNWALSARINALVTNGKAKILSRPNVTTIQGKEAVINVGSSVPVPKVQTTNSTVTTSIDYRDAGIILKYTPRINADGTITATIHTEVSTPQYVADMGAYRFNTRSADTTVTVRDGEPMVIGGLIGAEESKSVSKIPFLGDLPILGALFRNHKKSKSESELIIFLTAHVLDGNSDETLSDKP